MPHLMHLHYIINEKQFLCCLHAKKLLFHGVSKYKQKIMYNILHVIRLITMQIIELFCLNLLFVFIYNRIL